MLLSFCLNNYNANDFTAEMQMLFKLALYKIRSLIAIKIECSINLEFHTDSIP